MFVPAGHLDVAEGGGHGVLDVGFHSAELGAFLGVANLTSEGVPCVLPEKEFLQRFT